LRFFFYLTAHSYKYRTPHFNLLTQLTLTQFHFQIHFWKWCSPILFHSLPWNR